MTTFRNFKYQQELETLIVDPIIINMAWDIIHHDQSEQYLQDDSYEAMSLTSRQYNMLGGTKNNSIGGPQRAIKHLLSSRLEK